ncbi:hypothetical protein DIS24_g10632 [Lasiodiplodia hormozganensis]|uniref:Uncharacterized protein n=1 Tax=Lasiodiplodia hormozganensis TaxID=869390 RepID=A0AA39XPX0_9PEZI|nr:hypothetical protein DIS24_g10632 [Lasiodiplodia hormozganensis]
MWQAIALNNAATSAYCLVCGGVHPTTMTPSHHVAPPARLADLAIFLGLFLAILLAGWADPRSRKLGFGLSAVALLAVVAAVLAFSRPAALRSLEPVHIWL